jgi:hypothetical protein
MRSMPERGVGAGHRVQVPHPAEQFAGTGAAGTLAMALKHLNWR